MGDLVYAWIASLASTVQPVALKVISRSKVQNPWLMNLLWTSFGAVGGVVVGLALGGGLPASWSTTLLLSFSSALFFALYTLALFNLDVSTITPLFSLRTVFAIVLGVVFLGEELSIWNWILISIILVLSPAAAYSEQLKWRAFLSKYVLIAIVAMASLAAMGYYTNRSVEENGFATTVIWQDLLTFLMLIPTLFLVPKGQRKMSKKQAWPFLFIAGLSLVYTVSAVEAFSRNLALSSVIISLPLSMILAVALARKYPHLLEDNDKRTYVIRFTAAGLMIVASVWLTLS